VGPGVGIPSFLVAFVGVLLTIYYKRKKAERARLTAAALAQNSQVSQAVFGTEMPKVEQNDGYGWMV
jgi:hypothetical protein